MSILSRFRALFASETPYSAPTYDQFERAIKTAVGEPYTPGSSIYTTPTYAQMERLIAALSSGGGMSSSDLAAGVPEVRADVISGGDVTATGTLKVGNLDVSRAFDEVSRRISQSVQGYTVTISPNLHPGRDIVVVRYDNTETEYDPASATGMQVFNAVSIRAGRIYDPNFDAGISVRNTFTGQTTYYTDSGEFTITLVGNTHIPQADYWYSECLSGDTAITMADGSLRPVSSVRPGDLVLAFDPATMTLVPDEVMYSDYDRDKRCDSRQVHTWSDGSVLVTLRDHSVYSLDEMRMKHLSEWRIGEHGIRQDGTIVTLNAVETEHGDFRHFTLFTRSHNNYFANGMLTGNRYSSRLYFNADGSIGHAPRRFSKYRVVEALMSEGVWDRVRAYLEDSGAYELYNAAADFREDDPHFEKGRDAVKLLLEWDDDKVERVLAACVA